MKITLSLLVICVVNSVLSSEQQLQVKMSYEKEKRANCLGDCTWYSKCCTELTQYNNHCTKPGNLNYKITYTEPDSVQNYLYRARLGTTSGLVHDKLTDAEIKTIFHRERRDVPDYKFINIKSKSSHRSKRELRPVEIEVDGKKIDLNLYPVEHQVMSNYIPVWHAKSEAGRQYNYKAAKKEEKKIGGIFYEDRKNMATLLAYNKDRYIRYDGVFGESKESKVIKAAPEQWRRSVSNRNGGNHFVFNVSSYAKFVPIGQREIDSVKHKLDKPLDTFYPKLLIVVDYTLFETLGKDVQETVKYVATFWNAVNLKYSKIEQPKIKIIVTGLIISEDPTAMEYVYRSRNPRDLSGVDHQQLLLLAGDYFSNDFYNATNFENYDAVITMANFSSGPGATLGSAYRGEICDDRRNVGYVSDDGNFGAVLTATHELGHLLNLPHDGVHNECNGYPDHEINSIMGSKRWDPKEYFWSQCSQRELQQFAWNQDSVCMKNTYRYRQHE